ncbi:tetratricopeptide repeat protein [Rhodopirellula sp. P2]|uniref:tetratricopeptide repeat protein n=1 Tax=Rhodopirellula sp. P2 TaxID=2127060 RepID=UPI0023681585|nr:tetratricopeptide repeat protein [Rhodopirellula sp. P2]WDQ18427.1 tetratricopeptide repeat protein [Rhodopirellula sp. P2]
MLALQDEAAIALEADDHDKAYRLARQVMRRAPDDPRSIFLMARVLGRRQRFPEAIQMLDRLALTTPDARLPVWGQTAQWMVQFGKWEEAERRFRMLLKKAPEATLVHRKLAELLIRQGRTSEAMEHLLTLCRQGDIEELELRHLLSGGQPLHGDTTLEELAPIGYLGRAGFNLSRGEWDLARRELEGIEPIPSDALSLLGRVYLHLEDEELLSGWSDDVSRIESVDSEWCFAKGAILARQGDHLLAVRLLCKAVLLDSTDSDAYLLLSQSLLELDRQNESQEAARRFQWISETKRIGRDMSLTEDRDDAMFVRLITNLDKLQRPWESLHWCGVRLAYAKASNSLSNDELDGLVEQIKQRSTNLRNKEWVEDRKFVLCGIDLDSLQQNDAPKEP